MIIAPSLLAANAGRFDEEIHSVEAVGADILVAGSAVFGKVDRRAAIQELMCKS